MTTTDQARKNLKAAEAELASAIAGAASEDELYELDAETIRAERAVRDAELMDEP
jgi:hypothetical protein